MPRPEMFGSKPIYATTPVRLTKPGEQSRALVTGFLALKIRIGQVNRE